MNDQVTPDQSIIVIVLGPAVIAAVIGLVVYLVKQRSRRVDSGTSPSERVERKD